MRAVIGLDLSLTSTGVAVVINGEPILVARLGSSGKKDDTLVQRRDRLNAIGARIMPLVSGADLVCIEAPSFASQHGHAHDRSGLWWLVVNRILADGISVVAVPPSCRAKYATGKGNADKDAVLSAVVRRYHLPAGYEVTKNDEADALILAAMGSRSVGYPVEESLPADHLKGMDGVDWGLSPVR